MKTDGTDTKQATLENQEGTQAAKGTAAVPAKQAPQTIYQMIEAMKPQIQRALPKHITADRMARMALTALRSNSKLAGAEATSLLGAIMTAAQLGLEPNTPLGQCYIIPYSGRAQFQMGYKGVVELAYRSGQYRSISAHAVDAADEFDFAYGLNPFLVHKPADAPSGTVTHYYAVYKLANGGEDFRVWSRASVEAHAKQYSQSYKQGKQDSPWYTAFDQMAKKTVILDLLRYAPKSAELAEAVTADNSIRNVTPTDPDLNVDTVYEVDMQPSNSATTQGDML